MKLKLDKKAGMMTVKVMKDNKEIVESMDALLGSRNCCNQDTGDNQLESQRKRVENNMLNLRRLQRGFSSKVMAIPKVCMAKSSIIGREETKKFKDQDIEEFIFVLIGITIIMIRTQMERVAVSQELKSSKNVGGGLRAVG